MTATIQHTPRYDSLQARVVALRTERLEVLAELTAPSSGDDADRATNVDGHVRVEMLDRRIAALEEELIAVEFGEPAPAGNIRPGDVVTLDFGDGPEAFLFGSVEQAADGTDVITPRSPLGQALSSAEAGQTITYAAKAGRMLEVTFLAVS